MRDGAAGAGNSSTVTTGGGLLDPSEALHYRGFIGRHG